MNADQFHDFTLIPWGLTFVSYFVANRHAQKKGKGAFSLSALMQRVMLCMGFSFLILHPDYLGPLANPLVNISFSLMVSSLICTYSGCSLAIWSAFSYRSIETRKTKYELKAHEHGPYLFHNHPGFIGLMIAFAAAAIAPLSKASILGFLLATVSLAWRARTRPLVGLSSYKGDDDFERGRD